MGVPGCRTSRTSGHHSDIYGPADHCGDCEQEGAQTQGGGAGPTPMFARSVYTLNSSAWEFLHSLFLSLSERGRLSPGPFLGGHPHYHLLFHGSALVRGRDRHLHRPHRLAEDGDPDFGPRRAAQIPWREVGQSVCSKQSFMGKNCMLILVFAFYKLAAS